MDTQDLIKKLISIPSFVDGKTDEQKIGQFIFEYLQKFPFLKVEKQMVKNGRFNIIAKDAYPTRLLLNGHMDTVQPKSGWLTDQYNPVIKNGKLYGLGAADMKSNVAAMLSVLQKFEKTKGLTMLFYIDEEYDFLGMKTFIEKYQSKLKPEVIISGDGNDMTIGNGCRGLIEITIRAKGLSGHASQPSVGKNAIVLSVKAINQLKSYLTKNYASTELGKTTCNLAYLQGGLYLGEKDKKLIIGREGNNIADIAEFVLDIRTADEKLDANTVIQIMKDLLQQNELSLLQAVIRHDAMPWITPKKQLTQIEEIVQQVTPVRYKNPGINGYSDMQMIWEAFGKIPTFTFGAGSGKTCHQANEYIRIQDIQNLEAIYQQLIQKFTDGIVKTL